MRPQSNFGYWAAEKIEPFYDINFTSVKISNIQTPIFITFIIIAVTSTAVADIIYFKDGMKTVCLEKAWEENGDVKCEYDGVVLTYKKAEVERIEKRRVQPASPQPANKAGSSKVSVSSKPTVSSAPAKQAEGLQFYDPRREYKYWISKTGKYKTFQAAMTALGKIYNRPVDWVQSHMGDSNDLNQIHRNLSTGLIENPKATSTVKPKETKVIEFYNPRRTHKYWTSETARHSTFKEAMAALAEKYARSPEWVKNHMGEVNDLNTIHQNLKQRKQQESTQ